MYGRIVLELPAARSSTSLFDAAKELAGTTSDAQVPVELLRYLVDSYKQIVERHTGQPFPQDAGRAAARGDRGGLPQLERAAGHRATASASTSPTTSGTAVNVQAMVFGNRDDHSGTGVGLHP